MILDFIQKNTNLIKKAGIAFCGYLFAKYLAIFYLFKYLSFATIAMLFFAYKIVATLIGSTACYFWYKRNKDQPNS